MTVFTAIFFGILFVAFSIFCHYELYKELIRETKTFNIIGHIILIIFGSLSLMIVYVLFTRAYDMLMVI